MTEVRPATLIDILYISDDAIMLVIDDDQRHVHLQIFHQGRSQIRVRVFEGWDKEKP